MSHKFCAKTFWHWSKLDIRNRLQRFIWEFHYIWTVFFVILTSLTSLCIGLHHSDDTGTEWGRVTHICVSKLTIIGSDNGLSPSRRQAIIWNNAGILLIGPWGTNFSEILTESYTFSSRKMHLKMSSGKWRPFCLGLHVFLTLQEHCWDPSQISPRNLKQLTNCRFICSPTVHVASNILSNEPGEISNFLLLT